MSIESIIREFGVSLHIWRPTIGRASDGEITRTYAVVSSATGFIQPSSQGQDVFEGRMNSRTAGTIYFAGVVDVRIDDEIRDQSAIPTADTRVWRVTGAVKPADIAAPLRLSMTAVEVVEVEPDIPYSPP
jgi:hypothetical protein